MRLIEQVVAEYARLYPGRNKPADQFSDEMIALCSLLDQFRPSPQPEPKPE